MSKINQKLYQRQYPVFLHDAKGNTHAFQTGYAGPEHIFYRTGFMGELEGPVVRAQIASVSIDGKVWEGLNKGRQLEDFIFSCFSAKGNVKRAIAAVEAIYGPVSPPNPNGMFAEVFFVSKNCKTQKLLAGFNAKGEEFKYNVSAPIEDPLSHVLINEQHIGVFEWHLIEFSIGGLHRYLACVTFGSMDHGDYITTITP
ncbi:hypothetical protein [Neptuniibacter sp. QD37_11]|uniref:hypothetical protein n=1 Tax=Neptuniibacter sp. QD37_11 TaxID=3398209 RepID=UPI0039F57A81